MDNEGNHLADADRSDHYLLPEVRVRQSLQNQIPSRLLVGVPRLLQFDRALRDEQRLPLQCTHRPASRHFIRTLCVAFLQECRPHCNDPTVQLRACDYPARGLLDRYFWRLHLRAFQLAHRRIALLLHRRPLLRPHLPREVPDLPKTVRQLQDGNQ